MGPDVDFPGSTRQTEEQVQQNNEKIQEKVLPSARNMEGFKGVLSMGDRQSGKGISLTFWETEEAMKASEEEANQLRQQAADETADQVAGVERYEVYIYELPQG